MHQVSILNFAILGKYNTGIYPIRKIEPCLEIYAIVINIFFFTIKNLGFSLLFFF